jgi:quercetin dioxygenase-like cupin family protein
MQKRKPGKSGLEVFGDWARLHGHELWARANCLPRPACHGQKSSMPGTAMKPLAATAMSLLLLASMCARASQAGAASGSGRGITIARSGSQASGKGPAEHFTGSVRIDPIFQAQDAARASGARVTFEPGARTAWHTHPLGQILIVTAGTGWVQQWGGPIEEIREGDVVRIPPGQKHWHGATPATSMTHLAIQENLDGKVVVWMEQVIDEQYRK